MLGPSGTYAVALLALESEALQGGETAMLFALTNKCESVSTTQDLRPPEFAEVVETLQREASEC